MERKWQKKWNWRKIHETEPSRRKPKYYVTAAYPYPNSPQHIGHARTYTIADVNARYHRMKGYNTLFPMGFHYTGTPLFAMSKRLREGDPEIVETFTKIYGIPQSTQEKLKDPKTMASYFREDIKKGMEEIGFSIDWRREFTTIDPLYNRYIEWHFQTLKQKGLITKGTHPVAWCPNDKSPVGVVDTMGDVEPDIGESYLVKFEQDGAFYPTSTLRPETIFGVTNLWVNPDATYTRANVDGESWIVSKEAVEKLQHQNHNVTVEREIRASDLLWKTVHNPVTAREIPIFPGSFVQPDNGTGLVMSVPGHAPYDFQALADLKEKYASSPETGQILQTVQPISIIRLEGFSDLPAADLIEKFKVKDQKDPRLEHATQELYSKEFHDGVMKENTGSYSGMHVAKAREAIVQELTRQGKIQILLELRNAPVVCRCGTKCLVHILENQWFINYGDPEWKKLAHKCLDQMVILPEELRPEFNYTMDWLKERACARAVGLGTKLPWDMNWIIEALSDSVVYMAYYILSKYFAKNWVVFRKFEKDKSRLSDAFFSFTLLGHGTLDAVARQTGIPKRILSAIRAEFEYFYPVDMRHSARDLVSNHLSFYIFHHSTLFPEKQWPKGIVANGFVLMEGAKMSKSLENIIPLRQGIAKFGADPVRVGVMVTAELGQDTDFSETLALSLQERLAALIGQSRKLGSKKTARKSRSSTLDRWMISRLSNAVHAATNALDRLRVRETINVILYHLENDIAWYNRRLGPKKSRSDNRDWVLRKVLETRTRMLAPLAPHTAEEMWSRIGNTGFVVQADWPEENENQKDPSAERAEALIRDVLDDTGEILKATGITPKRIAYYTATDWKWQVLLKALKAAEEKKRQSDFIKEVMADPQLRSLGKAAADYAGKAIQQANQMPNEMRRSRLEDGIVAENSIFADSADFYRREFKCAIDVWQEGDPKINDPKGRARMSEPYRPAIYLE
ncbi:MAG TPA: leucine--tRNA ligase [Candidatus Bathyarchaeia archaeon]|nr:leucine--tRNA ligase [Candidatus Bathyarchaeia archaeon]